MDRLWEGVWAVMGCRLYGYGESASKDLSINLSLGAGICIER
jgi:4-hydroxy-3-methylbut-2-en-1-yl diphosphate synthase IspG/GcpE